MIIDTKIIDVYLKEKSLNSIKDHWIFTSIVEGKYLMDDLGNTNIDKLRYVYDTVLEKIKNFKPLNHLLWKEFFQDACIPQSTHIYLIVGSPYPFDAMVRKSPLGGNVIILDLNRISGYTDDINKLSEIVISFLTHEISHIITNEIYPVPCKDASTIDILKHVIFDEGIAHFLAFKEGVLTLNWYSSDMILHRKNSYATLISELNTNNDAYKESIIERAKSGLFWDKFGAISGLFAIIDYYNDTNKDITSFRSLFEKGPDFLFDFIINKCI
ncbi:hypothetical protein [Clostridium sp. C8-1-8]|uniref:hypothetical protein n=1 Tax=Clostridium sp. C8-1-8 TaxID=2698831 RepID=UPI001369DD96|nr:hypothetical protein [Clostridium sp. C8-1-8]